MGGRPDKSLGGYLSGRWSYFEQFPWQRDIAAIGLATRIMPWVAVETAVIPCVCMTRGSRDDTRRVAGDKFVNAADCAVVGRTENPRNSCTRFGRTALG
jgi:hypothetical protein